MIKECIIGCGFVGGTLKEWMERNNPECKLSFEHIQELNVHFCGVEGHI